MHNDLPFFEIHCCADEKHSWCFLDTVSSFEQKGGVFGECRNWWFARHEKMAGQEFRWKETMLQLMLCHSGRKLAGTVGCLSSCELRALLVKDLLSSLGRRLQCSRRTPRSSSRRFRSLLSASKCGQFKYIRS